MQWFETTITYNYMQQVKKNCKTREVRSESSLAKTTKENIIF